MLSTTFAHLNAGKASKVLDLEMEADRAALRQLVESADVVIESFQPGELDAKGLGYKDLAEINPGIVMASISAFGQTGPKKNFACNDLVALAESGFLYISGDPSWRHASRRKPRPTISRVCLPRPVCSPRSTGASARAKAITSTRRCRRRLATQEHIIRLWANEKQILKRAGRQHGSVAPAKIFQCRDGFVYLYVTRQHWKLFLSVWKDHRRCSIRPTGSIMFIAELMPKSSIPRSEAFIGKFTMAEITDLLQAKGIPCVPVNTPMGFANDEHVRGRGFMAPVEHAGFGSTRQPAMPFVIDGAVPRWAACRCSIAGAIAA